MPAQGRAGPGLSGRLPCLALVAVLAFADLWTKDWAFSTLPAYGGREILPPVLSFTRSENQGIVMGIGSSIGWVFTLTSFAILGVLLWMIARRPMPRAWRLAMAAIASGALGNGLDRLRLGHVRDFIDVHYAGWTYPTFNLADSAICVGAAVLAFGLWKSPEEGPHSEA